MEIKNKGIEFEVRDTAGGNNRHLGDLVITKSKVIWCKGRTSPSNGIQVSWNKFIEMMEELR